MWTNDKRKGGVAKTAIEAYCDCVEGLINGFLRKYIDDEGKTIVDTPGAGSGEPPEGWYLSKIAQAESLRRSMVVVNNIEPVRLHINERVAIEERHFNPIVGQSHFVPRLPTPLYALGFARFFQGDSHPRRTC